MPHVSFSEIALARKCLKAHDYRYHQKLQRRRRSVGLFKGSVLHEMLDAYVNHKINKNYQGGDPWDILEKYEEEFGSLFREQQEEYGDFIQDCSTIFKNYLLYYRRDKFTYEEVEAFVATDLTSDIRLIGYLDKIAVDDQGRRWIVDHKFVKTIPSADDLFVELQLLTYFWAWERFNPSRKIDGIVWDYVRTKPPVVPETLKRGGLSVRKNMDTTARVYLEEINRQGLDPLDYAEMLEHLQGKEHSFFNRVQLPRPSHAMVDTIVQDYRTTAIMIQKLEGVAPRTMNSRNCSGCEFRPLCESEVRGHDSEFIKKSEYEPKKNRGGPSDSRGEEQDG